MKILSIGKKIQFNGLNILSIDYHEATHVKEISTYDYIIISGGDGAIRRTVKVLKDTNPLPPFIINPTGSFNVIAKRHGVPKVDKVLNSLLQETPLKTNTQKYYSLNEEVFLFSAGNMGDLQHIFLSETLRFGILQKGILKYLFSVLFLFPVHLVMTPFMLLSSKRFFIFTPMSFIRKFGSFYGKIEKEISINLENNYNLIELDGDVVTVEESLLKIKPEGNIEVVSR
ncbi:MAG: Unknown protein [uncultured Sulfurovum sp.]|uniref:DAGKc domain-containing protein n=1 Tax=uncultured Sulfurovum sp. TaxID=269237 RepID=A0A6S6S8R5_9BACT|nr:MAG: Unknown protein [uncultured Sulfurovum sp.]